MLFARRASIAVGIALGWCVLYFVNPATTHWLPGCPLHEMTGLSCPGCGTTRALHQLLHGHLAAAFALNPLTISLLPLAAYVAWRGGKVSIRPVWIWVLLSVAILFSIARNIPLTP